MTRRLSVFDSPFLLGFDQFERALDRIAKTAGDGYPPYNIEQIDDTHMRISVAVAGFAMEDLSVQLENNQLTIRGKKTEATEETGRAFLHRGIATRQFQRSFVLSDEIVVEGASLDHGLLHVELRRILPETTVQTIEIRSANGKAPGINGANGAKGTARAIDVEGSEKREGRA